MRCDAIVRPSNPTLLGGGGVDGAIRKAAGEGLSRACRELGGCEPGQAKLTGGYNLPCKYVIHTVGPIWLGGGRGERELLYGCYRESLRLALASGCESVAFPLISSGAYGYPKEQALGVAVDAVTAFLAEHEMRVYLVVFDKASFRIGEKLFRDITAFIDDRYVDTRSAPRRVYRNAEPESVCLSDGVAFPAEEAAVGYYSQEVPLPTAPAQRAPIGPKADSLEEALRRRDESFSQSLLRLIDEKGMTDVECYKRANVDRRLFSKIRSDPHYQPRKTTALAFAIALGLNLEETKKLLQKAGFALTHSSKFDIIVEYFIQHGNYNIYEINEALFAFDQVLLGV